MIEAMSKPRPPYLLKEKNRHKNTVWYFRKGDGPRIRIRGEHDSPEFKANYQAALTGIPIADATRVRTASLRWLWDKYRTTPAWLHDISAATRRQRENIMVHVLAKSGEAAYGDITSEDIEGGKDERAATPAQARNFLDCMKGLFRWAASKQVGHVAIDPTLNIKNVKRKKGPGFVRWTEEDVEAYQRKYPIGTKERVWLDMLLYTGPRRGDAVTLGRQHLQMIWSPEAKKKVLALVFKTEKSREMIEVTIPVLPVLWKTLEAGPTGDLAFIVGDRGHPLTKESFGNVFSEAARKAGLKKKSAHGVRKCAATMCANNGATVHQLMAIFGWTTTAMAELYTREADRRRNSMAAGLTLSRTPVVRSIPAPRGKVRG